MVPYVMLDYNDLSTSLFIGIKLKALCSVKYGAVKEGALIFELFVQDVVKGFDQLFKRFGTCLHELSTVVQ